MSVQALLQTPPYPWTNLNVESITANDFVVQNIQIDTASINDLHAGQIEVTGTLTSENIESHTIGATGLISGSLGPVATLTGPPLSITGGDIWYTVPLTLQATAGNSRPLSTLSDWYRQAGNGVELLAPRSLYIITASSQLTFNVGNCYLGFSIDNGGTMIAVGELTQDSSTGTAGVAISCNLSTVLQQNDTINVYVMADGSSGAATLVNPVLTVINMGVI